MYDPLPCHVYTTNTLYPYVTSFLFYYRYPDMQQPLLGAAVWFYCVCNEDTLQEKDVKSSMPRYVGVKCVVGWHWQLRLWGIDISQRLWTIHRKELTTAHCSLNEIAVGSEDARPQSLMSIWCWIDVSTIGPLRSPPISEGDLENWSIIVRLRTHDLISYSTPRMTGSTSTSPLGNEVACPLSLKDELFYFYVPILIAKWSGGSSLVLYPTVPKSVAEIMEDMWEPVVKSTLIRRNSSTYKLFKNKTRAAQGWDKRSAVSSLKRTKSSWPYVTPRVIN